MRSSTENQTGILLVLVAFFLWSTHGTVAALSLASLNGATLALFASALTAVFFLIASLLKGRRSLFLALIPRNAVLFLGSGIFIGLARIFFFEALASPNKIEMNTIIYLWPMISIYFVSFVFPESWVRGSLREWALIFLAFLGTFAIVAGISSFEEGFLAFEDENDAYFLMFAFAAAITNGLYMFFLQKGMVKTLGDSEKERSAVSSRFGPMALHNIAAAMAVFLYVFVTGQEVSASGDALFYIIYVGVVLYFVAELFSVIGIRLAQSDRVTSVFYVSPLLSAFFLSYFTEAELTPLATAGIFMIIFANAILHLSKSGGVASVMALVSFLGIGLFCYLFEGRDVQYDIYQVVSGVGSILAILIGFLLSRVVTQHNADERAFFSICAKISGLAVGARDADGAEQRQPLLSALSEFDADPVQEKFENVVHAFDGFSARVKNATPSEDQFAAQKSLNEISAEIGGWASNKAEGLSIGEFAVVFFLSLLLCVIMVFTREPNFWNDLVLSSIGSGLIFIVFLIKDYADGRIYRNASSAFIKYVWPQRDAKEPFVPGTLIEQPSIRHAFAHRSVVFAENGVLKTKKLAPPPFQLHYLQLAMALAALAVVAGLLLAKYST